LNMYYLNIKILIFLKKQPCPFDLYGLIGNGIFVTFQPLYYAITLKTQWYFIFIILLSNVSKCYIDILERAWYKYNIKFQHYLRLWKL
jgi:hypothetical protein